MQGATCGGCVRSIEQTLRSVSGVSDACMDLATGVASVVGMVESNALIEALDRAGFPSTQIN
ncbi:MULTISPECIES: heavy metal-associated domain-containing protein [Methylophaga]|uniref:heavy-metal-associated domain-containing protein n=1 Tax=Methylophaga TaxID=40222 RepID=UPI001B3C1618|nr:MULTISPECIES: heavy metal-associated domain-containing protein [Methylophaga]MCB2425596.1 heavy-metal-associated domain-containing protein [Methylophaga pinxianii]UPH47163.1 heavy-metal-associated domain-containing protein [Methylophaga pinxianii]